MKKSLIPGLIVCFAVTGFALVFCEKKEDSPVSQDPPVRARAVSHGRLGKGTVPDSQPPPKTREKTKRPAPANAALTPDQEAEEAARLARIAEARATFEAAVAAHDEAALASLDFLTANGQREGVTTTASGLQYEVVASGAGPQPAATDTVKVHYHGTLPDGTVFDSSIERGEPVNFPLEAVVAGWTEGLQQMPAGSTFKLFIPSWLAYGEQGTPPKIARHAALIFEVELLSIEQNR